jgi:hypothetical protein
MVTRSPGFHGGHFLLLLRHQVMPGQTTHLKNNKP